MADNTSSPVTIRGVSTRQARPEDLLEEFGTPEVDTESTGDAAFATGSEASSTASGSEGENYRFENGRRYHSFDDAGYFLPNDNKEVRRLELQHRIWRIFLSNCCGLAPIPDNVSRALDLGCGTGAWCLDFAEAHPKCHIMGIDLSSIHPTKVPSNVDFKIGDFSSKWDFGGKFDYIHSRSIQAGVRDWARLIDQVWENLEPGGYVELQEYHWPFLWDDDSVEQYGSAFKTYNKSLGEASRKLGIGLDAFLSAERLLKERGFVKVARTTAYWPLGPWAKGSRQKQIGILFREDIIDAVEASAMGLFIKGLGWKEEDVRKLITDVQKELKEGKMHIYFPQDIVWAQKPADATDRSAFEQEVE